jgi:hypothetical protein
MGAATGFLLVSGTGAAEPSPVVAPAGSVSSSVSAGPRITSYFKNFKYPIMRKGENHFAIRLTPHRDQLGFFLFRVEGAKGRTLRIDLENVPVGKWRTLNPLISYAPSVDELRAYRAEAVPNPAPPKKAPNGPLLPDTRGQDWHFVEQVKVQGNSLSLTVPIHADHAFLAMRYPYTADFSEQVFNRLDEEIKRQKVPYARVVTVGASRAGRPLRLVVVAEGTPDEVRRKPTIAIYAREHADEQDGSWIVHGALEFLVGSSPEALALRKRAVFILIPMLHPDGAVANVYKGICYSFGSSVKRPEPHAWAQFMQSWINAGCRLDLVINLHNCESAEIPHLLPPCTLQLEGIFAGRTELCWDLHRKFIAPRLKAKGFEVAGNGWGAGMSIVRYGWWLGYTYRTLCMVYEANVQAPGRHLTLRELKEMGAVMAQSSVDFLYSPKGAALRGSIDKHLKERLRRMERYKVLADWQRRNVFSKENLLPIYERTENRFMYENDVPQWFKPVYADGRAQPPRPLIKRDKPKEEKGE